MERETFKFVKLVAEIGLFFAKVDNDYDERERTFLTDYVTELKKNNPLEYAEEELLKEYIDKKFTLDDIIQDTEDLLNEYVEKERYPLLNTLATLIIQVINADGKVTIEEQEAFDAWKKHFDIK